MKKIVYLIVLSFITVSCKQNKVVNSEYVISQFREKAREIEKVEYYVQRIDTFPNGFASRDEGFALVENNENDKFYGFSCYGKSNDSKKEFLYVKGKAIEFDKSEKNYESQLLMPNISLIGSPGAKMINENIFHLDSIFKNVTLIEKENTYLLKYTFEPESLFDTKDSEKIVELRKTDFFPIKVTYRAKKLGRNYFTQQILTDIKINNQVKKSVADYKDLISNFDVITSSQANN